MSDTNVHLPAVPQPSQPGDIVGVILQNTATAATPAQPLTFGEVFKPGAVARGAHLVLRIDGVDQPVQMDAKTFNADGSVAVATLTALTPSLAPGSSTGAMLALQSAGASGAPVDLASALGGYRLAVNLDIAGEGARSVDAVTALEAALKNGSAEIIRSGPLASEASVRIPISGSFYLTADITAFANGTFSSDVTFNNDVTELTGAALPANYDGPTNVNGGTVSYSESIVQNGAVVSNQANLTQYQYQNWHTVVGTSGPASAINIQHDIPYLEATGAVPNYDPVAGVAASVLATESAGMAAGWGTPLSPNGITQYMPGVGGRADIGPTTLWNAAWLMTQNATAARYALGQADAAGAVPWNFFNPNTGNYFTTEDAANIWTAPTSHTEGTSYPAGGAGSAPGWVTDPAHQPDLSYVAYLMTGSEYYLNELNAQAAWSETAFWPADLSWGARNGGEGLVADTGEQVRGTAWSLREIDEAAHVNPPGSPMQQYFQGMEDTNFSWLVQQIPAWTATEGTAYGWLPGNYGNAGTMPPWQQDYLASTVVQAAEQGNADAKTFLAWQSNFLVGRFLNGANGFNPRDGVDYNLGVQASAGGPIANSWAQLQADTVAHGVPVGDPGWANSNGDYAELALQSLAGIITVLHSPDAIKAYGWLLGSGAPFIDPASMAAGAQFDIVPRLPDGNLLTANNVILGKDAAGTSNTITGSNADQLIEAGAGNDTVWGGTGTNILFGGAGSDLLVGGPGSDYLYGGAGASTLAGGAGTNYLDAGAGPTAFLFATGEAATNTLAGFRPGVDHLDIVDGAGHALSGSALTAILGTASADGAGGTVLHLSASNTLTLDGVAPSALGSEIFGSYASGLPTPPSGGDSGSGTGGPQSITLSTSGNDATGGSGLFTVEDDAGGNTIAGGAGGLDLTEAAGADVVATAPGAKDTLSLVGADTVTAGGNDTISALGAARVTQGGDPLTFVGGAGTSTITGGSGQANITGGTGGVSVAGGTGSMVIKNGGGPDTVTAGAGNVTLEGGTGALRFAGGSGQASISGGAGGMMLTFGSGDATVSAGTGSDMFLFDGSKGGGSVTIDGFRYGSDSLNYQNFPGNAVESYAWGATAETLNLSDGTKVTLNFASH